MYEANFPDLVNRDNSTLGNWSSKQGEEQSMHKLPRPVGLQASPERTDSSASADLTAIAVETIGVQATDEHVREEWTDQASRADNSGLSVMAPPPATPIDRVTPDQRVRTVGKSGGGRPTQDTISKRDEALRLFGFNLTDASGRTTCPFCGWGRASKEKKKIEAHMSECEGSPGKRQVAQSKNRKSAATEKRRKVAVNRCMQQQAGRQRSAKQKRGRPLTNGDGWKKQGNTLDRNNEDLGGRYPRNFEKVPKNLGTAIPIVAVYKTTEQAGVSMDPTASIWAYPLPAGKTHHDCDSYLAQNSFRGFSSAGMEAAVIAAEAYPPTSVVPSDARPPMREELLSDDSSLVGSYIRLYPCDLALDGGYCYIIDHDVGSGDINLRMLYQVDDRNYKEFHDRQYLPFPLAVLDKDFAFDMRPVERVTEEQVNPYIREVGQLFVMCPRSGLCYGIVNLPELQSHEANVRASDEASAKRVATLRADFNTKLQGDAEARELRRQLHASVHGDRKRSQVVELYLTDETGQRTMPPSCRLGAPGTCMFGAKPEHIRFGSKGRHDASYEYKIVDVDCALQFAPLRYYCSTHQQWESTTGKHCSSLVGHNGIGLSQNVAFPGRSRVGITAAALALVVREMRETGNASATRRAIHRRWLDTARAAVQFTGRGLTTLARQKLRQEAAQLGQQIRVDLPDSKWFQTMYLAHFKAIRQYQVAALEQSLALVLGGTVGLDFGHTVSGCITTNSRSGE
jgi:hypothetical protein